MNKFIWLIALVLVLVASVAGLKVAYAQEGTRPVSDDEVNAIAKQMFCPVCENIPLDVCPTQACAEWRELIRLRLSEGWSAEQIKVYFAEQYGDRVLGEPPARGLNWLVYILPPLAFLIGVYILFRVFKAWKQPGEAMTENVPAEVAASSDDEYIARLEEELKKR